MRAVLVLILVGGVIGCARPVAPPQTAAADSTPTTEPLPQSVAQPATEVPLSSPVTAEKHATESAAETVPDQTSTTKKMPTGKPSDKSGRSEAQESATAGKDKGRPADPETAGATARTRRSQAQQAAGKGDYGGAFRQATEAWEAAKQAEDPALMAELEREMTELADQANRAFSTEVRSPSTTLIER